MIKNWGVAREYTYYLAGWLETLFHTYMLDLPLNIPKDNFRVFCGVALMASLISLQAIT